MSTSVRLGEGVAWVEHELTVYVARLPDGPPLVLAGAGAVVWRAVLDGGTLAQVCDRVAARTAESAEVVAPGVLDFVDSLVRAGVLVRAAPGA